MKIVVDRLPYYGEDCPFESLNNCNKDKCPRNWSKYFVCSNWNPHECDMLVELKALGEERNT